MARGDAEFLINKGERQVDSMNKVTIRIGRAISIGAAIVFAMILTMCSMTTVETGHRGVKTRFGAVIGEPLTEGLYFVNPFTTKVKEMDTRTLAWNGKATAYTRDVQQATIFFVMNYRLDPAKAGVVFQTVGTDWVEKLVAQVVYEEIEREFGQHIAVDVVSSREKVARTIETNVTRVLLARSVLCTGFQLTNIDYTDAFEHAVEAKVVAQQKAIEEQNRTVQIKEQAAQKIETARGDADSTLLKAKAEAESIRIRAQALESNPRLVEFEAVKQWDGHLPQYMLGGGAVPFLNLEGGKK
jgi:regulator of protease activity HflC (stomatin/prohibitin superfamily)